MSLEIDWFPRLDFGTGDHTVERAPAWTGASPGGSAPTWRDLVTILLLPGLDGSGPGHWQRRWADEIADAAFVEQDDRPRPNLERWLARAVAAVEVEPGAFLVGHCLGAVLAAHLATRRPDLPIAGLLLVAPADVDRRAATHPRVASFAPLPVTPLAAPAIVVASRDDPWMSIERSRSLAEGWEAGFVDVGEVGHVNAASGLGLWTEGLALLDRLRRMGGGLSAPRTGRLRRSTWSPPTAPRPFEVVRPGGMDRRPS